MWRGGGTDKLVASNYQPMFFRETGQLYPIAIYTDTHTLMCTLSYKINMTLSIGSWSGAHLEDSVIVATARPGQARQGPGKAGKARQQVQPQSDIAEMLIDH